MKLIFKPKSKNKDLIRSTKEYEDIWNEDGSRIVNTIEEVTELQFKDSEIEVIVFEGISQSHPMKLRASHSTNEKKATLIHELCHRISADYMIPLPNEDGELSLELHKQINLVLFDLWKSFYGEGFAKNQVERESSRNEMYRTAWKWALKFNKEERRQQFKSLVAQVH